MSNKPDEKSKEKAVRQQKIKSTLRKQKYKELLDIGINLAKQTDFDDVAGVLKQINNFVKRADTLNTEGAARPHENASELMLDAQVIKIGHELVGAVSEKIGHAEFHEQDMINAVHKVILAGGSIDWDHFEPISCVVLNDFRFSQAMLGTYEPDPVITESQPKERAKRQKTVLSQQKRPDTVDKLKKEEKGANKLNLIMNQIHKIYTDHGQQPIYYYELITDPDDFMNTVDNAFQVSFLVRDGNLGLSLDDNQCPVLRPVAKSEQSQKSTDSSTVQSIVSLNPKLWRDAIEQYDIKEPMLIVSRDELPTQRSSQASQMNDDDD